MPRPDAQARSFTKTRHFRYFQVRKGAGAGDKDEAGAWRRGFFRLLSAWVRFLSGAAGSVCSVEPQRIGHSAQCATNSVRFDTSPQTRKETYHGFE